MNAGLIADSVIVVLLVTVTVIFYVYSKNKITIDKKAVRDDTLARVEKVIVSSAKTIIYQTEREGGSGKGKLLATFSYLIAILDLARLPHPSTICIKGEIRKSVTTMKQTENFVDSMQTLTKEDDAAKQLENRTIVGELKEVKK